MMRMPRWLLNGAAAMSAALCIATGLLGVRSHRHSDRLARCEITPLPRYRVRSDEVYDLAGTLVYEWHEWDADAETWHRYEKAFKRGLYGVWPTPPRYPHDAGFFPSWNVDIGSTLGSLCRPEMFANRGGYRWGFDYRVYSGGYDVYRMRAGYVLVPMWAPCLLLAGPSVLWVTRWLRRRRHPAGHCPCCGYHRRATPEAGGVVWSRRPECGYVPSSETEDSVVPRMTDAAY